MNTQIHARPPEPPYEYEDFHYEVAFDDQLHWHVPPMSDKGCRFSLSNPRRSCGRPAVASLRRGKAGWWNYCDEHLYGRWIEDGKVAHWRLVKDENMSRTEKMFNSNRHGHRHGGKRIPNFVRPEERIEHRRRPIVWFGSIQDLFNRARKT